MILIYSGTGTAVSSRNGLLEFFDKKKMPYSLIDCQSLKDHISKASLLIIPGGRDLPYFKDLKGEGNRLIREFVEKGGSYLGICAGAYYASSFVEFAKGTDIEVTGKRELQFFGGKAIGPVYKVFAYDSEVGARLSPIQTVEGRVEVYHNGGCYFEEPEKHQNTQVLARYSDLECALPAIIQCKVGKGKAILSGVHLEMASNNALDIKREKYFSHILSRLLP